jgi:glucokinase
MALRAELGGYRGGFLFMLRCRGASTSLMVAPQLLLGDVGGTNIRFTLVPNSRTGDLPPETHHARYRTASFAHLREALAKFRREAPTDVGRIAACVLSVCGPVDDGRAICLAESMGASGWTLEEADLGTSLGCTVKLLNDFVAVGLAVGSCNWRCDAPAKLLTIHEAHTPPPRRTIAVLGPGTGLGSCYGVWLGAASSATGSAELQIFPSEGGESDFVPRSDFEWALRQHLASALGTAHVKVEHHR